MRRNRFLTASRFTPRFEHRSGQPPNDMIHAKTANEIAARRKSFLSKWKLRQRPVADSLEEAGDQLFTFTHLPPSQWKRVRTTNAIDCLHEECKRRIETQAVLPSSDAAAINDQPIDLAA